MGDTRNYAALEWVIGEIGDTLKEARQALEAYVEDPKDSTRIRFCLTHIHQVHGTLQMVEFHGASLLAEEMEQLSQALLNDAVSSAAEAHEVLMRSLLQLPIYLDHVKAHRDDHPGVILPLLNDLRAVRKQSYLSETNLFAPDLSFAARVSGQRHPVTADAHKLKPLLGKLREMYQFAAAAVLRGVKVEENLGYLNKVCSRLESLTAGTPCYPVWNLAAALAEGLERDDIELSVAVRGLLRHLARELRILTEETPQSFDKAPRESLLKNLLYYVARADDGSKRIESVKQNYKLDKALLYGAGSVHTSDKDFISAPDPEAIRSVVLALQDEMNAVKHILDISLTGQGGIQDLTEVLPIVKRIADTLAVLGIGDLRKQIVEQHEILGEMCSAGAIDEDRLMQVAGRIIEIEHRLQAIARGAGKNRDLSSVDERGMEIDQAKSAVLTECQKGLEQAKDAIVEYIASRWDASHLASVSGLMSDIRGGLEIIPLPRPAAVMETCGRYIQEQLLDAKITPDWQTLDKLADAIASVDYYLERLQEDGDEDLNSLLDIAEESITSLGYTLVIRQPSGKASANAAGLDNVAIEIPPKADDELNSTAEQLAAVPVADPVEAREDAQPEIAPPQEEPAAAELTGEVQQEFEADLTVEDAKAEPDDEAVADLAATPPEAEQAEDEEPEESDIDEEIIEIFVEEAGEVQETLAEFFPLWRQNPADQDSLTIVRRAFHTLKGSGRMVKAMDIGELAWSIENMLNRVLDTTITIQDEHFALIEMVLDVLPVMVKAFEDRRANPLKAQAEQYKTWAFAAAEGNLLADFQRAATRWLAGEREQQVPAATTDSVTRDSSIEAATPAALTAADQDADDADDGDDMILWEIFASEAESHLATIEDFVGQMEQAAPLYTPPSDNMQRALHTLKGSAHMAHVTPIAELAAPLESFVKELRSYQVNLNDDIMQLIKDGVEYTRVGLAAIEQGQTVELPKLGQFLARTAELRELSVGFLVRAKEIERDGQKQVDPRLLSIFMAEEMKLLLDADQILQRWQDNPADRSDIDPLISELVTLQAGATQANLPEMAELADLLCGVYHRCLEGTLTPQDLTYTQLRQGHDVLLDMVDAVAAGQNLQRPSDELVAGLKHWLASSQSADQSQDQDQREDLVEPEQDYLTEDQPANDESSFEADEWLPIEETDLADTDQPEEIDYSNFATEDISGNPEPAGAETADELPQLELDDEIELTTPASDSNWSESLSADAGEAARQPEDALSSTGFEGDWDFSAEILGESSVNTDEPAEAEQASEELEGFEGFEEPIETTELEMLEGLEEPDADVDAEIILDSEPESEPEANAEALDADPEDALTVAEAPDEEFESAQLDIGEDEVSEVAPGETQAPAPHDEQVAPSDDASDEAVSAAPLLDMDSDDYDPEIIEIFLEEADELIDELDEAIHAWELDWEDTDGPDTMARALHTLKGGARLAGLMDIGELTHEYESYLLGRNKAEQAPDFFPTIQAYQDKLLRNVRAVKAFIAGEALPVEPERHQTKAEGAPEPVDTRGTENAAEGGVTAPAPVGKANVVPFAPKPKDSARMDGGGEFSMPASKGGSGGAQAATQTVPRRSGPQEVIKISADLLEELVNLAGETSISRGRLETQINDLAGAIDEIDGTLSRLQEQLRRLDIETEAQIIFRQEQLAEHEDFDPLEMDRYSQLQQLSRSLIESASDLVDLKATLTDKVKDTETLLLQQSRVNTNLQEGLMRSRMVPFSRLVPRLRRIVRQVAGELGKDVNFELDNIEGEMDRSVLERMVAPLEHMLRNAVDHGVEKPADRIKAGKPETGRIVLTLAREGGDVLLRLADDGRGINLKRVREKAIERGLMSEDAPLSDHDIMQFILHAGFSTAETVTQISGRGVGMDVVYAEIKQLGGSMAIASREGEGTEFSVRLPFTVSVNRALMVNLGMDQYAIPLNAIEGIVRVSPFELEHYYSNPEARFEYAGENFQVRYMGSMLNNDIRPRLEAQSLPLPVILVRSEQHTMALQVDSLMGSREIVVKSVGPQFSTVQGLSGATVMGDGSVVVILDLHALVRKEMALAAPAPVYTMEETARLAQQAAEALKTVMVVDDSVTVRKVTTRFLEREGFNVITAKDGVDALRILQDELPDVMLLDIEMPRMDGFEVAKNIRTTSRWQDIPIIMITSRTGEKHREHALSLGVNKYMGKPYQEEALLESINELLAR